MTLVDPYSKLLLKTELFYQAYASQGFFNTNYLNMTLLTRVCGAFEKRAPGFFNYFHPIISGFQLPLFLIYDQTLISM